MWLLFLELLPELLSLFGDSKNKGKKHAIIMLSLFMSLCVVIYYDIYLSISISIIIILTIFSSIHYLHTTKNKYIQNNCVNINQNLMFINKKIPITYQQILGSNHKFIAQNKEIEFLFMTKHNGHNYIIINHEKIHSLPLSPIFHYGMIFYQKVIDIHGDIFDIKVMLSGFFSPALTISIEKAS